MYDLILQSSFKKRFKQLIKRNKSLKKKILDSLDLISRDPFNNSLKTHRSDAVIFGIRWSSRVTGDLRIIWDFDVDDRLIILVLTIGGHSGNKKVYK